MSGSFNKEAFDRIYNLAREGLSQAGKDVRDYSIATCPVDTGALKASIAIDDDSGNQVVIGAHTHYAFFVEMGTKKISPRAYLRGALDLDRILATIKSFIRGGS